MGCHQVHFDIRFRILIIGWLLISCCYLAAQESQEMIDFEYGERLYAEGLFSMAVIQFDYFVEQYPNSPKAHEAQFLSAESAFSLEQYEKAQKSYLKLCVSYPSSPSAIQAQFRIGECYERMGNNLGAIESYSRFYNAYPESQWALESLYRAGQLAFKIDLYQKSESFIQLILELSSSGEYRSKSLFLLSQIYQEQNDFEKSIQILKSYIAQPILESEKGKALYLLAQIYETMGNWHESENTYRQITVMNDRETFKPYAWFRLGLLFKLQVQYDEALNAFQQVIQSGVSDSLYAKSMYAMGEIRSELGNIQSAYDAFSSAENSSLKPEERLASQFQKAKCLELLGEDQQAHSEYQGILDDTVCTESILKKSRLSMAQLYVKIAVWDKAVQHYKEYLALFKDDLLSDLILLRLGEIYIDHLNQFDSGFQALSRIWEEFSTSPWIPEARYFYAETLERIGRTEEAVPIYTFINRYYIGTQWAEKAHERLKTIETYYLSDYKSGLAKLTELIQKTLLDPLNSNLAFELGEVSYHDLKQYKDAIQYYKRYLSLDSQLENRDVAQFRIGQCYESLYFINNESAYLDSAKNMYRIVKDQFPNSPYACDAGFQIANLESDASLAYQVYGDLLGQYTDCHLNDEILYQLGCLSDRIDSVQNSLNHFDRLIREYPESSRREEAIYEIAKIHYHLGNVQIADSLFTLYCEYYSSGSFLPEIYFYQARNAIQQNDFETAVFILERLNQRFSFSPWSDSAQVDLAYAYLKEQKFEKAAAFYQQMVVEDSLREFAVSVGLIENMLYSNYRDVIGLAKAYEGLKNFKKAKALYLKLLSNSPETVHYVMALSSLARIAQEENHIARAIDYLNQIIDKFPSDSTYERLGLLYYQLENYEQAVSVLDQAVALVNAEDEDLGLYISRKIIVALIRQGKIQQTEVRITNFEKIYRNNPQLKNALAEFIFEKGLIYTQRKEFNLAIECFEEITDTYDETSYVPDAELEIGRIYLITNQIDQALNKLTQMVDQYPDHPILAKVYLNLGDHYFRSNQYENALRSFRLSIQYDLNDEITPVAMRYLIRTYDSLRMWDAALSTTREYIALYPDAEDILEKRVQIGIFYMDLNEYMRAVEYLRDVKRDADFETEAEIQYWIGKCFYSMGQFEQAIFEFLKVEYLSKPTSLPWDTTALYEAGLAYTKLEKTEEARKLFEKIVQKEGATSDLGRIARARIEEIESM
ncbi:tetratricopeptide repeat protein [bacterium]|nr:tetratricopeptide repeat protein [bacterium]RQV98668.1 MAG: outer membrane protein assembly factor BamD [bacterium]